MGYEISINSAGEYQINDVEINNIIFDKELFDYRIEDRENLIDNLIDWIGEAKESDKLLIKTDLKYLMELKDDYVFSSIVTNEYIAVSDNKEEFDELCFNLLELNECFEKVNEVEKVE